MIYILSTDDSVRPKGFQKLSSARKAAQREANKSGRTVTVEQFHSWHDVGGRPYLTHPILPKARGNPTKKTTKLERKVKAAKASAKRRVAVALAKYLKQVNPSATHAKVQKLKGGVIKITPLKNGAKR